VLVLVNLNVNEISRLWLAKKIEIIEVVYASIFVTSVAPFKLIWVYEHVHEHVYGKAVHPDLAPRARFLLLQ
jgi:hypothetical protein